MGTHLRVVLSESYTMNTNMTGFRWFSFVHHCDFDESCLSIGRVKRIIDPQEASFTRNSRHERVSNHVSPYFPSKKSLLYL